MWKSYCAQHNIGKWTASPADLTGYIQSVFDRNGSMSCAYQHLSAVAYFYRLKSLRSPSEDPFVLMYMKGNFVANLSLKDNDFFLKFLGLKRHALETGPETRVARPMTRDIMAKINDFIFAAPRTLRQWRTVWRINLAFFCLLRWDDVCRLQVFN